MEHKSKSKLILSEKNCSIDPSRDYVVTGRERHVAKARAGELPYPQRAIRTGFVDAVLPLSEIATAIQSGIGGSESKTIHRKGST